MTEQEQSDYVAAKMGIIFLCENCRKRVHSIADKAGNVIGWIHTESEGVVCDNKAAKPSSASPASLQTLTDMFEPKPLRVEVIKKRDGKGKFYVDIEADWFTDMEKWLDSYESFKKDYYGDKW